MKPRFYSSNLCPDEKGTESASNTYPFTPDNEVATYAPMKRGLKVGEVFGVVADALRSSNLCPDEKGTESGAHPPARPPPSL